MSSSAQSADTTRRFARVLGPFFAIVSATVVARAPDMRELLAEFGATAIWSWVTGAFVLMGGIIVVALHPYWRGAAAVIVSLLGWIMVLRGVLLLAFPDIFMSIANHTIGAETIWRIVFGRLHTRRPVSNLRRLDRPSKGLGGTSPRLDSRLAPRCLSVPSRQRRAPSQAAPGCTSTARVRGVVFCNVNSGANSYQRRGLVSAQPGRPGRWLRSLSAGAQDPRVPARRPVRRRFRRSRVRQD